MPTCFRLFAHWTRRARQVMDAIADVNRLAIDDPPRELLTMEDALLGVGVGVIDVELGPDQLPLEFLGPPPAGLPDSPLPFAASVSTQAVVFLEDRLLGQGLRISLGCLGTPGKGDLPLLSSPASWESGGFCTIDPQENSTSSGTSAP